MPSYKHLLYDVIGYSKSIATYCDQARDMNRLSRLDHGLLSVSVSAFAVIPVSFWLLTVLRGAVWNLWIQSVNQYKSRLWRRSL